MTVDFLEYSDISSEVKGAMCLGRLKLTDQHIIFKNSKTGKVEQINASDLELVNWQRLVGSWGIRLFLKNGILHRFAGFKEAEQEKVAKFFSSNYKKDMLEKELSLKGWNWGTAKFSGAVLSFDVGSNTAFEIPLNNVSQCTTGKNEVTLEFHQNDDAPVSLMEMRFHIPSSEMAGDIDPVEAFHQNVMKQASVISLSGDAITTFKEIQCLTPRGRYDIKIFQSFFQLHGKTFDYKIPMSTVLRLFVLPHKDSRQMFFVVSLDPPIKQGQTRYHYLVFQFGQEEDITVELPISEEELQEKYEGKLSKEMTGPTYEILGKVMKAIVNRKITTPGNFVGHSGTPAISCSYKAAAGYLYPLERGFIYVHKPPVHIRFEEIVSVNFARSGGGTRSFDFEIETKSSVVHTFSSIEKDEYGKLFDFITAKKLRVKNRGKSDKLSYAEDFGDSDQEDEPDAYLARVKAEAEERDDEGGGESDESSTDEDFKPNEVESDVAEEYDSNPSPSDSEEDSDEASDKEKKKEKKEEKEKKEKPPKKAKTVSEKPRKKREKKEKDENKPKRPATAFMMWLNASREKIKADNPGIAVTEIAKKGGEMWRELKDKSEWEAKAAKAKEEYNKAMKEYKPPPADEKKKEKKEPKKRESKPSPVKAGAYKSKEYISDDSSDSDDEKKTASKKKADSVPKEKKPEVKKEIKEEKASDEEEDDDDFEEPIEKTPPTSEDEESASGSESD
ncbi:FACT complex subunit Ssrp1 isoform X1 [Schistocerca cancellata]|uniref:FACT complex subunit Ssrp1 isoform X1 n=1 Tax=Schistocerca cancellata TaxID=274614 RepID=UPI002118A216|nr:FACT complex subunit Ssrp1 isoform X1 [Schistocerca cancellata]